MAEIDQGPTETPTTEAVNDQGPYSSFVLLMDEHNQLLQRESKGKDKETYLTAVQDFLKRAGATGAVLQNPEERYTAQSLLNYWMTVLYRADIVYTEETTLAAYDAFADVKIEDQRCPYPGVSPFKEKEHKFFFGRQRQINYMMSRLQEDRLLAIVGPSGSGKTSLVLAGLVPEIRRSDRVNNAEHHYFPVITPGSKPLAALLGLFTGLDGDSQRAKVEAVQADFQSDWTTLLKLVEGSTKLPTIMVIDHFHELFIYANYPDRRAFLGNLDKLINASGRSHTVIVTMQEVNYESYLRRPERFRAQLDPAKVSLPSMSSLELRDAIEKPGAYVGMKFPEPVVKALVNEAISEPIGLPLLQFMLYKLWVAQTNKKEIQVIFDEMRSNSTVSGGACREALARSAEEFFTKLDLRDNVACRRLLKQLVTFDNDFRAHSKPRRRADLYLLTEQNSRMNNLIDRLAENQLVRVTPGAIAAEDEVELTHDSLLRSWPRMKGWVSSLQSFRKRLLVAKVAAGTLVAAMLLLAVVYAIGWRWEVYKSRELARLSKQELANERFDLALLLGLSAYQTNKNPVSQGALVKLLHNFLSTPRPALFLSAADFSPQDLSFSSESDRPPGKLAAINREGKVIIWRLNWEHGSTRAVEETVDYGENNATSPIVFSPDSKLLVSASTEPNVLAVLWDTTNHQPRHLRLGASALTQTDSYGFPLATALVFSPNGKLLFAGGADGKILQWDITDPQATAPVTLFQHTFPISSLAVSAKGNQIAVGDDDGAVFIIELGNKRVRQKVIHVGHTTESEQDEPIYYLSFNNDGSLLAASRDTGPTDTATIWDVATGKLIGDYNTGLSSGLLIAFTGDQELTGFNTKGVIFKWDVKHGLRNDPIFKPLLSSNNASFSTNGNFLALPSPTRNGAIIWDLSHPGVSVEAPMSRLVFKPDLAAYPNQTLLIGQGYGIELWDTNIEEHERLAHESENSSVTDVAYSKDGSKLATALNDGTIQLRNSTDLKKNLTLARNLSGTSFTDSVASIAFDPVQTNRLAAVVVSRNIDPTSSEEKNEIVLWDTNTGLEIPFSGGKPPIDPTRVVTAIAFSSRGNRLVWASSDENESKVAIWDLGKNQLVQEVPLKAGVFALAFRPGDNLLALGLGDGTVDIWDIDNLQNRYTLRVGSGYVTDVAFSPVGGSVLACATNPTVDEPQKQSTLTVWDLTTREQLGDTLKEDATISSIAFSSDGNILASGYGRNVELLGPLNVKTAETRFCEIINCRQTYNNLADNRIVNPLDQDSAFQTFYRAVRCRQSLRTIHKVDETPPGYSPLHRLYRRVGCPLVEKAERWHLFWD